MKMVLCVAVCIVVVVSILQHVHTYMCDFYPDGGPAYRNQDGTIVFEHLTDTEQLCKFNLIYNRLKAKGHKEKIWYTFKLGSDLDGEIFFRDIDFCFFQDVQQVHTHECARFSYCSNYGWSDALDYDGVYMLEREGKEIARLTRHDDNPHKYDLVAGGDCQPPDGPGFKLTVECSEAGTETVGVRFGVDEAYIRKNMLQFSNPDGLDDYCVQDELTTSTTDEPEAEEPECIFTNPKQREILVEHADLEDPCKFKLIRKGKRFKFALGPREKKNGQMGRIDKYKRRICFCKKDDIDKIQMRGQNCKKESACSSSSPTIGNPIEIEGYATVAKVEPGPGIFTVTAGPECTVDGKPLYKLEVDCINMEAELDLREGFTDVIHNGQCEFEE